MEQYYIALIPDENLIQLINEQKRMIRENIGNQKYLNHPPHITLVIFTTDNLNEIIEKIGALAKSIKKFNTKINNFHIFYNDSMTNRHTITYSLSEENIPFLREIQLNTINAIKKFNTKNFNYHFIGKDWIPHISVASIEPDKFDLVFEKIKQKPIQGEFSIDSINLYRVGEETSFLIKSFELR